MENIYGQKTDNASNTFEKIRKIKLFSNETDNLEIAKKITDITSEICIKCEDIIEAFYQYEEIIFSKDEDAVVRKLLYNALTDSKEKFFGKIIQEREENVSYYKKTIEELTAIIEELKQENAELVAENKELIKKVKKMEDERTQIFEWVKGNPVKTSNESVITKLADLEMLSNRKDLYKFIKKMENEEKDKIKKQSEDKPKEENQINTDSKEREEK